MSPETAAPTATRNRLDRRAVVDTAVALVDEEGLDALTIRHLARALGVTPTALYWHFADKQAVLDGLGDRLWEEALEQLGPNDDEDPWAAIRAVFDGLVTVFRRHPALAALAPTRVMDSPAGLAVTERSLDLLARCGYDPRRAAEAARFMLCTALMLVTSVPGAAVADPDERDEMMRHKRAALLTLPPGRYPRVEGAIDHLVGCDDDPEPYFRLGVDLIIGGLRATAGGPAR